MNPSAVPAVTLDTVDAIAVPCDLCGAPAGESCRTRRTGHPVGLHDVRRTFAFQMATRTPAQRRADERLAAMIEQVVGKRLDA